MTQSLNEIEVMAKKATRGAGRAWGVAEEAGRATRWLEAFGKPGAALLVDLLKRTDGVAASDLCPVRLATPWQAAGGTLCPLIAGTTLNDSADQLRDGTRIELHNLSHPLLIAPFAAWAASYLGQPLRLSWQNVALETDGVGLWLEGPDDQVSQTTGVTLGCQTVAEPAQTLVKPGHRGHVGGQDWENLNTFAHRTYAPATEESRALGAGAGNSDND